MGTQGKRQGIALGLDRVASLPLGLRLRLVHSPWSWQSICMLADLLFMIQPQHPWALRVYRCVSRRGLLTSTEELTRAQALLDTYRRDKTLLPVGTTDEDLWQAKASM